MRLLLAAAATALLTWPLAAQIVPPLSAGMRVRVIMPAEAGVPAQSVTGTLERLENDTAFVGVDGAAAQPFALDRGAFLALAVPFGSHARNAAEIGALGGAVVGGLIGMATYQACRSLPGEPQCEFQWGEGRRIALSAGVGAAAGAIAGYLIGKRMRRLVWVPVNTEGVRVALLPGLIEVRASF